MQMLLKLSDWIKSYGHLSKVLAYFCQFLHDLSLISFISRDHGCQFWKKNYFTLFSIKFYEKSPNFKELTLSSKSYGLKPLGGP